MVSVISIQYSGVYSCKVFSKSYCAGVPHKELLEELENMKKASINPEDGRIFAYSYTTGGDKFEMQRKAYDMFTG